MLKAPCILLLHIAFYVIQILALEVFSGIQQILCDVCNGPNPIITFYLHTGFATV